MIRERRKRRQASPVDDHLGASDGRDDGLAVCSGVGHREVDGLIDLLGLGFGGDRRAAEAGDDQVTAAPFEGERLDGAGADVQAYDPSTAKETL